MTGVFIILLSFKLPPRETDRKMARNLTKRRKPLMKSLGNVHIWDFYSLKERERRYMLEIPEILYLVTKKERESKKEGSISLSILKPPFISFISFV